jgi:hypothetical protein
MSTRRRWIAVVVVLAIAVCGVVVAWYLLGEAQRTGRLVGRLLSSQLGVPVTVEAAVVTGSRVRLRGVTVAPEAGAPVTVRAGRIDIDGGMLALVAPAGRRISVVAVAPTVTFREPAASGGGANLAVMPGALRALLDWPGDLRLAVEDARVQAGGNVYRVTTSGDKTGGVATAIVRLGTADQPDIFKAELQAQAIEPRGVSLQVHGTGDPSRLLGRWPALLPTPLTLDVEANARFAADEPVAATGRSTIGTPGAGPIVVDFTSSYDPRPGRLTVSRYSVVRAPDVRLQGDADVSSADGGIRVGLSARGAVEGSPLTGRGAWESASARFDGEASFSALDMDRIARRLGFGPMPASARDVVARFSGATDGPQPAASVQVSARQVSVAALPGAAMGATLDVRLGLAGGSDVPGVSRVDHATLTLLRDKRTVAVLTAASPPTSLWPLALQAQADDLEQLGSVIPAVKRLSGRARFNGEARDTGRVAVQGALDATVAQAELNLGASLVMSELQARVPVLFGAASTSGPGMLALARLAGQGVTVTDVTGVPELVDGRLLVRDVRYAHAGGRGTGWLEATASAGTPKARARLDAAGVDLAALLSEIGVPLGRATGRLRYTVTAQYPASSGLVALVRATSEEGGEVSIDAIQRLLESAKVQAETTGLLHQTLENLRVFPYESLTAEIRVSAREARLDLSLVGRKRLGIFPAPVEAINLRNVPLLLLARAFTRGNP